MIKKIYESEMNYLSEMKRNLENEKKRIENLNEDEINKLRGNGGKYKWTYYDKKNLEEVTLLYEQYEACKNFKKCWEMTKEIIERGYKHDCENCPSNHKAFFSNFFQFYSYD